MKGNMSSETEAPEVESIDPNTTILEHVHISWQQIYSIKLIMHAMQAFDYTIIWYNILSITLWTAPTHSLDEAVAIGRCPGVN